MGVSSHQDRWGKPSYRIMENRGCTSHRVENVRHLGRLTLHFASSVIHREDYYRVLYEEARRLGTQVRLSSAVTSANFNDTEVVLSTGEVLRADVVVVADGLYPFPSACSCIKLLDALSLKSQTIAKMRVF